MQRLRELLDAAVDHTSFDLGRAERVGGHVQRSYASRPDEIVSSEQLREILGRHSWHHEESDRARSALATIPDDLLSDMSAHVRLLFRGYIESSTDRIGHAFPIRDGAFTRVTQDAVDPVSIKAVSPVETFAKAIVRGAVVLGAERMMSLVSGWLQGEPVRYWAKAMLNGGGILAEPLSPMAGVRIESLPLSTDQLVGYLPRTRSLSLDDYLGRVVLTMDHSAAPALFRPREASSVRASRATGVPGSDMATVCQAISLACDTYTDTAFFWVDYGDLEAFGPTGESTWSLPHQHFRSSRGSLSTNFDTGATTLRPVDGASLPLDAEPLRTTVTDLADVKSEAVRVAVSRWMRSKDDKAELVDRFIDLRIALESLYLKDFANETSQEMRFRLPLFGAWHLGADQAERSSIRKQLRQAYDTASGAVHSGGVELTPENERLLADAQRLCREGILKLLADGAPRDCGDLILGVENAPEPI